MNYKTLSIFIASILYLAPALIFAKCSKDDIEFYLEKGFTQDQITQLCASSGSEANSAPDYKPYQQQVVIYKDGGGDATNKDGFTKEERAAIKTLKNGTNIYNLKVETDKMYFTRRVCIVTGNDKSVDRRFRDCPKVDFTIDRQGLIVESGGKTWGVFGQGTVTLKGSIKPKLQGSFDSYPVEVREGLKRNYDWKSNRNDTNVPVKGDFSITAVANAFRTLSTNAVDTVSEAIPGESRLDEEVSEEPVREAKVDEEKKKKWWNPFD